MKLNEVFRLVEQTGVNTRSLMERVASRVDFDAILQDETIMMGFECEMVLRNGHQGAAKDIRRLTGEPVEIIGRRHGVTKEPGSWYIEPDPSIEEEAEGDPGEIVSPAYSLSVALDRLKLIFDLATEKGSMTNTSTGLHINLSIAGKGAADYDFLKMMLFLDENYLAGMFNRADSRYAKQMRDTLGQILRISADGAKPGDGELGDMLQARTLSAATDTLKLFGKRLETVFGKDSSIRPRRNGVFEFRSMGGAGYHERFDEVRSQVVKMANVLRLGSNPELQAREYVTRVMLLLGGKYQNKKLGSGKPAETWKPPAEIANLLKPYFGNASCNPIDFLTRLAGKLSDGNVVLSKEQRSQVKMLVFRQKITREQVWANMYHPHVFDALADVLGWAHMENIDISYEELERMLADNDAPTDIDPTRSVFENVTQPIRRRASA